MKKYLLSLGMFILIISLKAQNDLYPVMEARNEFVLSVDMTAPEFKSIEALSSVLWVDKVEENRLIAYTNNEGMEAFKALNIPYTLMTPPSMEQQPVMWDGTARTTWEWDSYPTYEAYVAMMEQFAIDYPDLCELVDIGSTTEGRRLLFIHINSGDGTEVRPQFMYTSSIHGDEITGYVLMLRYIDYLLSNYGTDDRITGLVDALDIWINPLANPDGTYAGGNNTVYGATRANANGVDMNRNYADPDDGPHPDGHEYQDETLAFMALAEEQHFVVSCNIHGGAEVLNYPWDTWSQLHADDDWWQYVCREYADTAHAYSPAGYLTDLNNGITNGYAWYTITGGRQDYMNYFHHCREVTLEISTNKTVSAGQLPAYWEYNYRSFLNYMEQTKFGLRGLVTDALTGEPVEAVITFTGHDNNNSWVMCGMPDGDYYRPAKAGSYTVNYSATGYYPKNFSSINLHDKMSTTLNVQLDPILTLTADFQAADTIVSAGSPVAFTDLSYGSDIISWNWTFEGGTPATSVSQNPMGITWSSPGSYDVRLIVANMTGESDTAYKTDYIQVYDSYLMQDGYLTTCNALLFDSGGEFGDYSNNQDYVLTLYPFEVHNVVVLNFLSFSLEYEANCNYDYLEIYDGADMSAPLMGRWCGDESPGEVRATGAYGALTLYFHSDNSQVASGWKSIISCDSGVGVNTIPENTLTLWPNPVNDVLHIEGMAGDALVSITGINGQLYKKFQLTYGEASLSMAGLPRGLYVVTVDQHNALMHYKVIVQ